MDDNSPGTFEMSLRILGNELIGFAISVDDFKTKWLVLTMITTGGLAAIVATFGPPIKSLVM